MLVLTLAVNLLQVVVLHLALVLQALHLLGLVGLLLLEDTLEMHLLLDGVVPLPLDASGLLLSHVCLSLLRLAHLVENLLLAVFLSGLCLLEGSLL